MENKYYQRNKLANVLGISKETLRYYEDKHIIEPKRDPSNGYRAYDGYYDYDIPSFEFCERMYSQSGAFVTPGDCFEEPHSVRIGYASDRQVLKAGLHAFSLFLRSLE